MLDHVRECHWTTCSGAVAIILFQCSCSLLRANIKEPITTRPITRSNRQKEPWRAIELKENANVVLWKGVHIQDRISDVLEICAYSDQQRRITYLQLEKKRQCKRLRLREPL